MFKEGEIVRYVGDFSEGVPDYIIDRELTVCEKDGGYRVVRDDGGTEWFVLEVNLRATTFPESEEG